MNEQVIGLGVAVACLVVTDKISAVMVIVKGVCVMTGIPNQCGMVIWVMETDTVHIHEIVIHVDDFKPTELIACGEDKVAAMLICKHASGIVGGLGIYDGIVVSAVLHDYCIYVLFLPKEGLAIDFCLNLCLDAFTMVPSSNLTTISV